MAQLEKAERRSAVQLAAANQSAHGPSDHKEEHWFGCPVCLTLLRPPMRIFQCPEGHILCEECKENPAMVHCPQCRSVAIHSSNVRQNNIVCSTSRWLNWSNILAWFRDPTEHLEYL